MKTGAPNQKSTVRTNPDQSNEENITGNGEIELDGITDDSDTVKNDSDLTPEDIEALGPKDLSMDLGDDEQLKHRVYPVNFSGDDLDVPGSELDDEEESIGSEDEENNSYSIGGDDHDDLEEDPS